MFVNPTQSEKLLPVAEFVDQYLERLSKTITLRCHGLEISVPLTEVELKILCCLDGISFQDLVDHELLEEHRTGCSLFSCVFKSAFIDPANTPLVIRFLIRRAAALLDPHYITWGSEFSGLLPSSVSTNECAAGIV